MAAMAANSAAITARLAAKAAGAASAKHAAKAAALAAKQAITAFSKAYVAYKKAKEAKNCAVAAQEKREQLLASGMDPQVLPVCKVVAQRSARREQSGDGKFLATLSRASKDRPPRLHTPLTL